MELKEINEKSKMILSNFVDKIGLDGKYYISSSNCPMGWGIPKLNSPGEFVSPNSNRLQKILQSSKYDEKTKERLNQKGLILINKTYKQKKADKDLFVTTIHEMIHSNRNLLLFDAIRDNKNETAYTYENNTFHQNSSEYGLSYADASQEILKANIDTSKKTVHNYKNISSEELENIEFTEGKRDSQMEKQQIVDEALVELISVLSYKLYSNKENGKSTNIWELLEETKDFYEGEDISAMCKIILKHHDFELFNWMIDPITYSQGDIHYDFFGQYTKYDQELLQELYESSPDMEDILGIIETDEINEININDIKEIATTQTAIEELSSSFEDIKKAQNRKKDDIER